MVNCCVSDCTNYWAKAKGKNISYHRISKGTLPTTWIETIQRANWEDVDIENCHVCSNHFTEDCFESSDFRTVLTGEKGRQTLKRSMITILLFVWKHLT